MDIHNEYTRLHGMGNIQHGVLMFSHSSSLYIESLAEHCSCMAVSENETYPYTQKNRHFGKENCA